MAEVLKRTTKRNAIRIVFAVTGLIQCILFMTEGFEEWMLVFSGGMFIMISATNFCSQCPLISALKQIISEGKIKRIPIEKL